MPKKTATETLTQWRRLTPKGSKFSEYTPIESKQNILGVGPDKSRATGPLAKRYRELALKAANTGTWSKVIKLVFSWIAKQGPVAPAKWFTDVAHSVHLRAGVTPKDGLLPEIAQAYELGLLKWHASQDSPNTAVVDDLAARTEEFKPTGIALYKAPRPLFNSTELRAKAAKYEAKKLKRA